MEAHQEPSPEGLWEDIEQIIKKEHSIKSPSKQRKILLWGKYIGAVAAVAIFILFIGNYISNKNQKDLQLAIHTTQKQYKPEKNASQANKSGLIAGNNNRLLSQKINKARSVPEKSLTPIDTVNHIAKAEDEVFEGKAEKHDSLSNSDINNADNNHSHSKNNRSLGYERGSGAEVDLFMNRRKNKPAKWETNAYASNLSFGSTNKYSGYGSLLFGETPLERNVERPLLGEAPYGYILLENKYKEVYTDIKHAQPVTMGLSISYNLNEKWSITSGLTYTILSSQLRSGSDSYYYNSEQTLHNVGIPLNINYNVWRNEKISIYLSGGGVVEKNIYGELTTDYIVDNKIESSEEDKIAIDQLQWSLNTSVGIQYNLSKKIGVYAEPVASYYFKNGSEIETIYKEKPANIGFRFGLRLSLGE
jgi:hypothetical protein